MRMLHEQLCLQSHSQNTRLAYAANGNRPLSSTWPTPYLRSSTSLVENSRTRNNRPLSSTWRTLYLRSSISLVENPRTRRSWRIWPIGKSFHLQCYAVSHDISRPLTIIRKVDRQPAVEIEIDGKRQQFVSTQYMASSNLPK